ncbi:MAG TPA: ABC transporter permease [Trueperaceae bacterium]|nr:ABC transporter permease [Trueperaceae bacterium]
MSTLLRMEFNKLFRLTSVRFGLLLVVVFPLLWAYAPGIFEVYGFFLVSAFQVPALSLLSSMQFLLPLLVAITAAELLGVELSNGTMPTILLRPVTRPQWLAAKLVVVAVYPLLIMLVFLLASLLAGSFYGFGSFVGGTGLGDAGLLGAGVMQASAAMAELLQGYAVAALALIPVGLLSVLFTVVFMNAAGGALATLSVLIFMQLLIVFPRLEQYLLTTQLNAYQTAVNGLPWAIALMVVYSALFAAVAVVLFERKDF